MHIQSVWLWKIIQLALQTCAHGILSIFTVSKNGAPAGCTYSKIVHPAAKTYTPGAGWTRNFEHFLTID